MAFTPDTLSIITQPIGGTGIRFVSYRTDDSSGTVTGTDYFTRLRDFGVREHDLIFVSPILGGGDPYIVVVSAIDADGNGTAELGPSDTALQPADIGVTVQGYDALLAAIAALTTAAGGFVRTTGVNTVAAQAIVGTVAQSGGTPTGAIVETGSNANGAYTRWADGTQICSHTLVTTENVDTAIGSMFWQAADTTWTFPAVFTAAPTVPAPAGFRPDRPCGGSITALGAGTSVNVRAWAATTYASSIALRMVAIGRWF